MTLFTPIGNASGTNALQTAIDEALAKDQETLMLANLPANVWTDFPVSTKNPGKPIAGFLIRSSTGESLRLDTQNSGGTWQVMTGIALTNLQIQVEY